MEAAKEITMFPIVSENKNDNSPSFIPLKRSFFNHFLWKEKRTFSKCEAWLDMIQLARFEQSEAKELIGGKLIQWKRGQLVASVRFLAARWNWGKHKVEDFLTLLKGEKMILVDSSQGQSIITLLNYEAHNGERQQRGQQRGRQKQPPESVSSETGDSKGEMQGTRGGHAGDKTNKDNKEKNIVGAEAPAQKSSFKNWTEQDFIAEIGKHKDQFTYELRNAFFKYWKEKSATGKMRFQLEKTWETELRLENWARRDDKVQKQETQKAALTEWEAAMQRQKAKQTK